MLDGSERWRIIEGDCRDVLTTLPTASVDVVICDPPYGIAYVHSGRGRRGAYAKNQSVRRNHAPLANDDRPFNPAPWLSFPRAIIWGADHWPALPPGGTLLAWDKSDGGRGPADSFADCEFAWCSVPKIKRNVCRYLWKGLACVKAGEENGRRYHPTQKPVGLMAWCLNLLRLPTGGLVLDPYAGSATVGVACLRLGYRYLGIEIDPTYAAIARRRLSEVESAARTADGLFAEAT